MASRFALLLLTAILTTALAALADETAGGASPSPKVSKSRSAPRNSKGKHAREKEIEGSEARNRFQADTVIKSKYQLNGEQLEVDPD